MSAGNNECKSTLIYCTETGRPMEQVPHGSLLLSLKTPVITNHVQHLKEPIRFLFSDLLCFHSVIFTLAGMRPPVRDKKY